MVISKRKHVSWFLSGDVTTRPTQRILLIIFSQLNFLHYLSISLRLSHTHFIHSLHLCVCSVCPHYFVPIFASPYSFINLSSISLSFLHLPSFSLHLFTLYLLSLSSFCFEIIFVLSISSLSLSLSLFLSLSLSDTHTQHTFTFHRSVCCVCLSLPQRLNFPFALLFHLQLHLGSCRQKIKNNYFRLLSIPPRWSNSKLVNMEKTSSRRFYRADSQWDLSRFWDFGEHFAHQVSPTFITNKLSHLSISDPYPFLYSHSNTAQAYPRGITMVLLSYP